MGEAGSGQCGAIVYSVIENCRRRKIDPYAYLRDLLTRLPSMTTRQIDGIVLANWVPSVSLPPQLTA